jgi:peptidoglycan hydrolase-like protein with peptidoglycan-binding domain
MREYIKLVEQAEHIVEKKAKAPSKFKPTHFHLSNLSGIFGKKNAHTKLMYHDGAFWHMKRDEKSGKRKIAKWSGNPNNRSKMNPASVDGEIVGGKLKKFPNDVTFADTQREKETDPSKQGIDGPVDAPAGTDTKGRQDGPDALKPGADKDAEAAPKDGKLRLSGGETFYRTPDGKGLRLLQKHAGGLVRRMDELVRKMNESVPNSLKSVLSESDRSQLMFEALTSDEAAELVKVVADLELIANFKDEQGYLISDQNRSLLSDRINQYEPVISKAKAQLGTTDKEPETKDKTVEPDAAKASDISKDKGADKKADEKPIAGNLKKFAKSGKGGLANDPDEVEAVKELQQYLTDMGFDPNGVDGKYGNGTVNAVKEFQKYFGAKVDGDAGPETIGQIIKLRSFSFKGGKTFIDFRKDMSRMEELIKKGGAIKKSTENSSRDFRSLISIVEQSLTEALSDQEKKELTDLIAQYDDVMSDAEFAAAMPKVSYDRYKKIIDDAKKLDYTGGGRGDGDAEMAQRAKDADIPKAKPGDATDDGGLGQRPDPEEAVYKTVKGSGQSKTYTTYDKDGNEVGSGRGSGPTNLPSETEYKTYGEKPTGDAELDGSKAALNQVKPDPNDVGKKVEPRPEASGVQGDYAKAAWDKKYGKTHNPDGTPKGDSTAASTDVDTSTDVEQPKKKTAPVDTSMAGGEVAVDAQSKAKLDKLMQTGAKDKASAIAIAKQIVADPKLLKLLPPNEQAVMKQLAGM